MNSLVVPIMRMVEMVDGIVVTIGVRMMTVVVGGDGGNHERYVKGDVW